MERELEKRKVEMIYNQHIPSSAWVRILETCNFFRLDASLHCPRWNLDAQHSDEANDNKDVRRLIKKIISKVEMKESTMKFLYGTREFGWIVLIKEGYEEGWEEEDGGKEEKEIEMENPKIQRENSIDKREV